MDVRTAVRAAKEYVAKAFENEQIENIGLEEVEYDEGTVSWLITIGFSRPWDDGRQDTYRSSPFLSEGTRRPRDYRVVKVRDEDGSVTSIKLREFAA